MQYKWLDAFDAERPVKYEICNHKSNECAQEASYLEGNGSLDSVSPRQTPNESEALK